MPPASLSLSSCHTDSRISGCLNRAPCTTSLCCIQLTLTYFDEWTSNPFRAKGVATIKGAGQRPSLLGVMWHLTFLASSSLRIPPLTLWFSFSPSWFWKPAHTTHIGSLYTHTVPIPVCTATPSLHMALASTLNGALYTLILCLPRNAHISLLKCCLSWIHLNKNTSLHIACQLNDNYESDLHNALRWDGSIGRTRGNNKPGIQTKQSHFHAMLNKRTLEAATIHV